MSVNKHVGDYRLIEHFEKNGKVKVSTEYIGDDYYYTCPETERKRAADSCVLADLLIWPLWIAAMVLPSGAMKTMPVSLMYVCIAVPLFLLTRITWLLRIGKEPLERREAERIQNGYAPESLLIALLSAASFLIEGIRLIAGRAEKKPGEIIFLICAAAIQALSVYLFRKRHCYVLATRDKATLDTKRGEGTR